MRKMGDLGAFPMIASTQIIKNVYERIMIIVLNFKHTWVHVKAMK